MTESSFEHFFKPEVRRAATDLISGGAVYLKIGSDTQIDASVKASTPLKVAFRAESIESESFTVDCSCKPAGKGQLCKHIWATLVLSLAKTPDFFDSKKTLEKVNSFATVNGASMSPAALQRQSDFKASQDDYRKAAYQRQKARAKELKAGRADIKEESKAQRFLPEAVQESLKYFELNGFPLTLPVDESELSNAKRILSRVFHPDKGGTQDEILELLRHADILNKHR
jgi:uncharacterized Zn finger protein